MICLNCKREHDIKDDFCSGRCCREFHGIDIGERPDKDPGPQGGGIDIKKVGVAEHATKRWLGR